MYRPALMLALVPALAASPLLAQTSAQTDLGRATPIEHARVVLERVEGLAIGARIEGGVRRVGPMPRDFFAAFNLGSEEEISAGDANAVSLLAIQALASRVRALEETNASLRMTAAGLQNDLAVLRAQVERLEGERR